MVNIEPYKPIIFDKTKHLINLHNWVVVDNSLNTLDYGGERYCFYENEYVYFAIKGFGDVVVTYDLEHEWTQCITPGDYDTPPLIDYVDNIMNVSVTDIDWLDGTSITGYEKEELMERLDWYLHDKILEN